MDAIVINNLDLHLNPKSLRPRLAKMWQLKDFKLIDLVNSYCVIRTNDQFASDKILKGGPWTIFAHCTLVQRWSPSFNLNSNI